MGNLFCVDFTSSNNTTQAEILSHFNNPFQVRVFLILSKRLVELIRDPSAGSNLAQLISIAIKHGNTNSVLGTLPFVSDLNQLSYLQSVCNDLKIAQLFHLVFKRCNNCKQRII